MTLRLVSSRLFFYQAEILGAASGAEMADIEQMKKIDCSTHHKWNSF